MKNMKKMDDYYNILITNKCNLDCIFCKTKSQEIFYKELEDIKAEIDLAYKNNKIPRITGGEPLIHPKFYEIIDYLDKYEKKSIIETNGLNLNENALFEKIINKLRKGNIIFDFFIANFNNISHDFLTRKEGSFFELLNVLKKFKENKIPIHTHTVINKINYRYLKEIVKIMNYYGSKEIRLIFILPYGEVNDYFEKLVPYLSLIKEYIEESILYIIQNSSAYIYIENIPFCVIPYFEKYIQKVDLEFPLEKKGDICSSCIFEKICYGFYSWYLKNKAADEFVSIGLPKREKIESIDRIMIDEFPYFDNPYYLGISELDPKKRLS